jgi:RecA/RadA recombinase
MTECFDVYRLPRVASIIITMPTSSQSVDVDPLPRQRVANCQHQQPQRQQQWPIPSQPYVQNYTATAGDNRTESIASTTATGIKRSSVVVTGTVVPGNHGVWDKENTASVQHQHDPHPEEGSLVAMSNLCTTPVETRIYGTAPTTECPHRTNGPAAARVVLPSSTPTPQALLSRTPQALLQLLTSTTTTDSPSSLLATKKMTLSQCDELRHQVARAMILKTRVGQRNLWIHNNTRNNNNRSDMDDGDDNDYYNAPISARTSQQPLILGGTTSVWQSLQAQTVGTASRNPVEHHQLWPYTTTGCQELDDLLLLMPCGTRQETAVSTPTSSSTTPRNRIVLLGHVLQISGPSASGKTVLALQLALELVLLRRGDHSRECHSLRQPQLSTPPLQVVYLASLAGHSIVGLAQRLKLLVRERFRHNYYLNRSADPNALVAACLDNIAFQPVMSGHQLLQDLAHIEDRLWQEQQLPRRQDQWQPSPPKSGRLGMIVVDSIYQMAMVNAAAGSNPPQAPSGDSVSSSSMVLLQVGHVLKRLARQYSIAVVVTNGVVVDRKPNHPTNNNFTQTSDTSSATKDATKSSHTTTYKPALGEAWHHVAVDVHLSLEPHLPQSNSLLQSLQQQRQPPHHPPSSVNGNTTVVRATLKDHVTIMVDDGDFGNDKDPNGNGHGTPPHPCSDSPRASTSRHHHHIYLRLSTSGLQALAPAAHPCDDNATNAVTSTTTPTDNTHGNYNPRQAPRVLPLSYQLHHDRSNNDGVGVRTLPNKRSRPS